jgi:hypothetical protein
MLNTKSVSYISISGIYYKFFLKIGILSTEPGRKPIVNRSHNLWNLPVMFVIVAISFLIGEEMQHIYFSSVAVNLVPGLMR